MRALFAWATVAGSLLVISQFQFYGWADDEPVAPPPPQPKSSAYEVWLDMAQSGISGDPVKVIAGPNGEYATFGGEKEGSSSLITRVFSLDKAAFLRAVSGSYVDSDVFVRELMGGWFSGEYREPNVRDGDGNPVHIDTSELNGLRWKAVPPTDEQLREKILAWANQHHLSAEEGVPLALNHDLENADLGEKTNGQLIATVQSWIQTENLRAPGGAHVEFDANALKSITGGAMTHGELMFQFRQWLEAAGDRSYSFIKPAIRQRMFNGNFPGLNPSNKKYVFTSYTEMVPVYGPAEKFLVDAHATGKGWELNFKPQDTYAQHEQLIAWFRSALAVNKRRFEPPGHQWLVYPGAVKETEESKAYIGELMRSAQAYTVLKGFVGGAGMEASNHKQVHRDSTFTSPLNVGRGVIRSSTASKFGTDNFGIELRAGTKTNSTRRVLQQALTARIATGDFSGMSKIGDYPLIPDSDPGLDAGKLASRFFLSPEEARRAIAVIGYASFMKGQLRKTIDLRYFAPLWNWESAPYLSAAKKNDIRNLTRSFLLALAADPPPDGMKVRSLLKDWVLASHLTSDIYNYIKPEPPAAELEALMKFDPPEGMPQRIDPNKVDLGIEYSGRFSTVPVTERTPPLSNGKPAWLNTLYDITPDERRMAMRKVAETLGRELAGGSGYKVTEEGGGHGHGLGTSYDVVVTKNGKPQKWRVEWDGVSRIYDQDDEVVPESVRGGHIELVTPKFVPTPSDVNAVYRAFDERNIIPSDRAGGGHMNIDLAAFDGNPQAMARAIASFLRFRGIMSLMFQHPGRLKSAEPLTVTPEFVRQLDNFNGTENDLKKLLYNSKYFNTRLGRKTQYTQFDLSAYFQDVIPPQFVTGDYDLFNDVWHRQFNVDPRIRKGEWRMMDAPHTPHESALQIKFTRAFLNRVINDPARVTGPVQDVDYESYVEHPEKAQEDFDRLMADYHLNPDEFRGLLVEGLETARDYIDSASYEPLKKRLKDNPKTLGWERAVTPRSAANAITAEGRVWDSSRADPVAIQQHRERMSLRAERERVAAAMANRPSPADAGRLTRAERDRLPVEQVVQTLNHEEILPYLFSVKNDYVTPKRKMEFSNALKVVMAKPDFEDTLNAATERAHNDYALWLKRLYIADKSPMMPTSTRWLLSTEAPLRAAVYQKFAHLPNGLQQITDIFVENAQKPLNQGGLTEFANRLHLPEHMEDLARLESAMVTGVDAMIKVAPSWEEKSVIETSFNNLGLLKNALEGRDIDFDSRYDELMKKLVANRLSPLRSQAASVILAPGNQESIDFAKNVLLKDPDVSLRNLGLSALDAENKLSGMMSDDPDERRVARALFDHMHPDDVISRFNAELHSGIPEGTIHEWGGYLGGVIDQSSGSNLTWFARNMSRNFPIEHHPATQHLMVRTLKKLVETSPNTRGAASQFITSYANSMVEQPAIKAETEASILAYFKTLDDQGLAEWRESPHISEGLRADVQRMIEKRAQLAEELSNVEFIRCMNNRLHSIYSY